MKKQRGVSMTGLLMTLVAVIFAALLGFKLFDPYKQFFTIQKTFKAIAVNPEVRSGGRNEFKVAWQRYATLEKIDVLNAEDVEITRDGNNIVLSASYSVKVPLFKNISLLIDFVPSSDAK